MGLTWGLDPGPDRGAVVALTPEGLVHLAAEISMSSALDLPLGPGKPGDQWAIEWLGSYGAPPSQGLFRTALWIGRLVEAWTREGVAQVELWQRRSIKRQLLGKSTGGDPQVREALCEALGRVGPPGGGPRSWVGLREHGQRPPRGLRSEAGEAKLPPLVVGGGRATRGRVRPAGATMLRIG